MNALSSKIVSMTDVHVAICRSWHVSAVGSWTCSFVGNASFTSNSRDFSDTSPRAARPTVSPAKEKLWSSHS